MSKEQFIQGFENSIRLEMEQSRSLLESTKTRLVWFVGIAGFALLNGKSLWEAIASRQLQGFEIFVLSIPWLLSVLSALFTHFFIGKAEIRLNDYYLNKLSEIDLHKAYVMDGKDSHEEFVSILYDRHPDIKNLKATTDKWSKWVNRFETLALCCLVLGFLWSIVLSLILK